VYGLTKINREAKVVKSPCSITLIYYCILLVAARHCKPLLAMFLVLLARTNIDILSHPFSVQARRLNLNNY
jgi:hypothetical protein